MTLPPSLSILLFQTAFKLALLVSAFAITASFFNPLINAKRQLRSNVFLLASVHITLTLLLIPNGHTTIIAMAVFLITYWLVAGLKCFSIAPGLLLRKFFNTELHMENRESGKTPKAKEILCNYAMVKYTAKTKQ